MEIGNSIVVEKNEIGYTVRCGDRWADHLDAGESLWVVAAILTGKGVAPYLMDKAQHDAWNAKYGPKAPLEPRQKQLTGVQDEQSSVDVA